MASRRRKAGNLTGNLAMTLPAFLIPGAATIPGAAAVGAVQGLLQPSTSTAETAQNVGFGGAAGAGGVVAGESCQGVAQGAKALAEPFYQAGTAEDRGRVIQRFADDPNAVLAARGGPSITGAMPTIAEATGRCGHGAFAGCRPFHGPADCRPHRRTAHAEQRRAGGASCRKWPGKDGARDFASEMRSGTAKDLYDRALSVGIEPENLSPAMRGEVTKLLQMPAIQDAMKAARTNAQNHGMKLDNMDASIAGLHQTKLAMDDAINALKDGTAAQANKADAIAAARDRLVSFMEKMSPDYKDARLTYAADVQAHQPDGRCRRAAKARGDRQPRTSAAMSG
jgi:exonuclease VII small subunit